MTIEVKQVSRTERLLVHTHDWQYLSSQRVPSGYKARYKCNICPVIRVSKETYVR